MVKSKDEVLFDAICQIRSDVLHASNSRRKLFKHKRKKYDPNDEMMVGMAIMVLTGILVLVSAAHSIITKVNQRTQYEEGGDVIGSMDEFKLSGNLYNTYDQIIEPQYIADKIVTLTNEDMNLKFEIYEIQDIAKVCAVAVKLNDEEEYHLYNNTQYAPETLGQLVEDLSLEKNLVFEEVYVQEDAQNEYLCENYDKEKLYNCIFGENIYSNIVDDNSIYATNILIYSKMQQIDKHNITIKICDNDKLWLSMFNCECVYKINNIEEVRGLLNKSSR